MDGPTRNCAGFITGAYSPRKASADSKSGVDSGSSPLGARQVIEGSGKSPGTLRASVASGTGRDENSRMASQRVRALGPQSVEARYQARNPCKPLSLRNWRTRSRKLAQQGRLSRPPTIFTRTTAWPRDLRSRHTAPRSRRTRSSRIRSNMGDVRDDCPALAGDVLGIPQQVVRWRCGRWREPEATRKRAWPDRGSV